MPWKSARCLRGCSPLRQFARGEEGTGGHAELAMACRAFEASARGQVINIEASADRTYGRALRLRPSQATEPSIRRVFTFGINRFQRQCSGRRREEEVLTRDPLAASFAFLLCSCAATSATALVHLLTKTAA